MDTQYFSLMFPIVLASPAIAVVVHSAMVAYGNRNRSQGAMLFFAAVSVMTLAFVVEVTMGSGTLTSQMYGAALAYGSFLVWVHFLSGNSTQPEAPESNLGALNVEADQFSDGTDYYNDVPTLTPAITDTLTDPAWSGLRGNIYHND